MDDPHRWQPPGALLRVPDPELRHALVHVEPKLRVQIDTTWATRANLQLHRWIPKVDADVGFAVVAFSGGAEPPRLHDGLQVAVISELNYSLG
eukprot:12011368-Alexandrium_andersonii.AAC.1